MNHQEKPLRPLSEQPSLVSKAESRPGVRVEKNLSDEQAADKLILAGLFSMGEGLSSSGTKKMLLGRLEKLKLHGDPLYSYVKGKKITVERMSNGMLQYTVEQAEVDEGSEEEAGQTGSVLEFKSPQKSEIPNDKDLPMAA